MIELLFYTSMKCTDAAEMLERVAAHDWMSNQTMAEIIEVVQESTPHCAWDAND